jgi:Membrane MotB of proton-channel complex MotA/MotB
VKRKSKEEGEKPFWISFSDLMTALMVMFLVVMAVALLAVTSPASAFEEKKKVTSIREHSRVMKS